MSYILSRRKNLSKRRCLKISRRSKAVRTDMYRVRVRPHRTVLLTHQLPGEATPTYRTGWRPRNTRCHGQLGIRLDRSWAQVIDQALPLPFLELERGGWALFLGWPVSFDHRGSTPIRA